MLQNDNGLIVPNELKDVRGRPFQSHQAVSGLPYARRPAQPERTLHAPSLCPRRRYAADRAASCAARICIHDKGLSYGPSVVGGMDSLGERSNERVEDCLNAAALCEKRAASAVDPAAKAAFAAAAGCWRELARCWREINYRTS